MSKACTDRSKKIDIEDHSDDRDSFYPVPFPITPTLRTISKNQISKVYDITRLASTSYGINNPKLFATITKKSEKATLKVLIDLIRAHAVLQIVTDLESGRLVIDALKLATKQTTQFRITDIIKKAEREVRNNRSSSEVSHFRVEDLITHFASAYSTVELKCICSEIGAYLPHGVGPKDWEESFKILVLALSDDILR